MEIPKIGLKQFTIQIQEKENGNIINKWDYGTEAFGKQLNDILKEKLKGKLPWYLQFFTDKISDLIGAALAEAIDYMIKQITKKPGEEAKKIP